MCYMQGGNLGRKIYSVTFPTIQVSDHIGQRNSPVGHTEICADKSIMLYHTSLFAGHQGVIKTYLTISDKFFIPGLMHYLRSFLKGCHICQLVRNDKPPHKTVAN